MKELYFKTLQQQDCCKNLRQEKPSPELVLAENQSLEIEFWYRQKMDNKNRNAITQAVKGEMKKQKFS